MKSERLTTSEVETQGSRDTQKKSEAEAKDQPTEDRTSQGQEMLEVKTKD